VTVSGYHSTGWADLIENDPGVPTWSMPSKGNGRVIVTAEHADA